MHLWVMKAVKHSYAFFQTLPKKLVAKKNASHKRQNIIAHN